MATAESPGLLLPKHDAPDIRASVSWLCDADDGMIYGLCLCLESSGCEWAAWSLNWCENTFDLICRRTVYKTGAGITAMEKKTKITLPENTYGFLPFFAARVATLMKMFFESLARLCLCICFLKMQWVEPWGPPYRGKVDFCHALCIAVACAGSAFSSWATNRDRQIYQGEEFQIRRLRLNEERKIHKEKKSCAPLWIKIWIS